MKPTDETIDTLYHKATKVSKEGLLLDGSLDRYKKGYLKMKNGLYLPLTSECPSDAANGRMQSTQVRHPWRAGKGRVAMPVERERARALTPERACVLWDGVPAALAATMHPPE